MLGKDEQQCELMTRHGAKLAVEPHDTRAEVDLQPSKMHQVVVLTSLGAAQDRAQPRQQFARLKRLRQIVVGAQFKTDDPVHRVPARREHEDRRPAARTDATATGTLSSSRWGMR